MSRPPLGPRPTGVVRLGWGRGWRMVLLCLLACLSGVRIGEAAHPGPPGVHYGAFDDPEADDWFDLAAVTQEEEFAVTEMDEEPYTTPTAASLQPEASFESSVASSDGGAQPIFVPARRFQGSRSGYVFKLGQCGQGYYWDEAMPAGAVWPALLPPPSRSTNPVRLCLEELVLPPAGEPAWWLTGHMALQDSDPSTPDRQNRRRRTGPRRGGWRRAAAAAAAQKHGVSALPHTACLADDTWRRRGYWAIDTFNQNAWASAQHFLLHSPADAVAIQEVRVCDPSRCRRLEQGARSCGWNAAIAPASRTAAASASAGVAVAVRRGIGMAGTSATTLPQTHADRLTVQWTAIARRGGLHLVSIYLWTSEGLSERNLSILHHLSLLLRALRGPWVVAGDWNMEPEVLQAAGWPRRLGGQIFAPSLPTCGDRCYDFFLLDSRISHMAAGVQAISDAGGRPHRVSRLLLDGTLARGMIRQLVRPRAIPTSLPPTAAPRPADFSVVLAVRPTEEVVAAATQGWYAAAEEEFTHLRGTEAKAGDSFCGRDQPATFRWTPAATSATSAEAGATALSVAWRALAAWCLVLGQPAPLHAGALAARRASITSALRHLRGAAARRLPDCDGAHDFRAFALDLSPAVLATPRCMLHAFRCATQIAKRLELQRLRSVQAAWQASLCRDGQLTRRAYQSVKEPTGFTPSAIAACGPDDVHVSDPAADLDDDGVGVAQSPDPECPEAAILPVVRGLVSGARQPAPDGNDVPSHMPLGLQAATDRETAAWSSLWAVGQEYVVPEFSLRRSDHPGPIQPAMLRAACRTFPVETGLGVDAIQPVPSCGFPTRRSAPYAAYSWRLNFRDRGRYWCGWS